MEKLEKISTVALIVAIVGVIVFLVAGFNGRMDIAQGSFFTAGIASWVALASIGLQKLRHY